MPQNPATVHLTDYNIEIGTGLIDQVGHLARSVAPAYRYIVISDDNVGPIYGNRVAHQLENSFLLTFPAGEVNKTRETWAHLTDELISRDVGRDSVIIAVGGGVVGDMAGFVAATFMRGIPFVQVPTTLLAMIDASIGGKTGVDTTAGKNLVGSFHQPRAVIADPQVLDTLPLPEIISGLAEAVKHGAIADSEYFASLIDAPRLFLQTDVKRRDADFIFNVIKRSIEIKASVVEKDVFEGGLRKTLNFGHTIGHAIELLSDFTMPHGNAVSIGMYAESLAAEKSGATEPSTSFRLKQILNSIGLPTETDIDNIDTVFQIMLKDKKNRDGTIEYSIPGRLGNLVNEGPNFTVRISNSVIKDVLLTLR